MLGALYDGITIGIPYVVIPYNHKRLVFFDYGIENAAVVSRRHHDLTVGQHLRGLGSGIPEN